MNGRPATVAGRPRLLIVTRNLASLRAHYEDVIVGLVRAGVDVSVRYIGQKWLSEAEYREIMLRRGCQIRVGRMTKARRDAGDAFAVGLRQLASLLRFYHPDYDGREWLREAKLQKEALGPRKWAERVGRLGSRSAMLALRLVASIERSLPPASEANRLISAERPTAVVAAGVLWTPWLVDELKAASRRHIPTACWIQSWDNLTNKGLLNFVPDRVFVWNSVQRDELARYHRVPSNRVCITGAQTFDHWFDASSVSGREDFCSRLKIDPAKPILLYLASSRAIEPPSSQFFLRWLDAIRSSGDEILETATVLVRPHPTEVDSWVDLEQHHPSVKISPSTAAAQINSEAFRGRFRDELHHSSVVVGLNTSAMIDAAIMGKPVCTVELPDLPNRQRGTIHFEYLLTVGGGFVRTAASLQDHVRTLAQFARSDPYARDDRSGNFVRAFVRPLGLDVKPAEVFSREMLRLIEAPANPCLPSPSARAVGFVVHLLASTLGGALAASSHLRPWRRSTKRLRRWRRHSTNRLAKAIRLRARLKPIRHAVFVWLRAGLALRLSRTTGKPPFSSRAKD